MELRLGLICSLHSDSYDYHSEQWICCQFMSTLAISFYRSGTEEEYSELNQLLEDTDSFSCVEKFSSCVASCDSTVT